MSDDRLRQGPTELDGSIAEAIAELREGSMRGFYLVTSDGKRFTEVYHDLEPSDWETLLKVPYGDASRQLLLGYALGSLTADADQNIVEVATGLIRAYQALVSDERTVEYHNPHEDNDE